jgi:hypothetical protein
VLYERDWFHQQGFQQRFFHVRVQLGRHLHPISD